MIAEKAQRRDMGTFSVEIGVGNLDSGPLTPVSAVVDTGAFDSMFPAALLKRLGLEPTGREIYTLADGSRVECEVGRARIGLDGRELPCRVVFGPEDQYLLGGHSPGVFPSAGGSGRSTAGTKAAVWVVAIIRPGRRAGKHW